ncbi:MAG: hypothetical protein LBC18_13770 [Opitutaceae bacterium]|nr:hypothetical protein [Opitutaceae bacterium]
MVAEKPGGGDLYYKAVFPVLRNTCRWLVELDSMDPVPGAYSAIIEGREACGHILRWFAPDFLRYAGDWRQLGIVKVGFAGLAMELAPFDAKPIVITSGPRIREAKAKLRKEGKFKEARELKTVEFHTDRLRTILFSSDESKGNVSIIGKVLDAQKITLRTWERAAGYALEIEVLPDRPETGFVLPVLAFPPALNGYIPKTGDLVQGDVWLQGRYYGPASPAQQRRFQKINKFAPRPLRSMSKKARQTRDFSGKNSIMTISSHRVLQSPPNP